MSLRTKRVSGANIVPPLRRDPAPIAWVDNHYIFPGIAHAAVMLRSAISARLSKENGDVRPANTQVL